MVGVGDGVSVQKTLGRHHNLCLPRGGLTEICGPASSGRTSVLMAAMAARTLPTVGFRTGPEYSAVLDYWTRLVLGAAVPSPDGKGPIQDNRVLPEILQGIDRLFGGNSAAALIVQAILLHQSLNVVPEWPNPGSLSLIHRTFLLPLKCFEGARSKTKGAGGTRPAF